MPSPFGLIWILAIRTKQGHDHLLQANLNTWHVNNLTTFGCWNHDEEFAALHGATKVQYFDGGMNVYGNLWDACMEGC